MNERVFRAGVAASALLAAGNLLSGLSGGLARLGLPLPAAALVDHGAVMVCAFFGTLITLERAVALKRAWGLLAPLAAGLGGVMAWGAGLPQVAGAAWCLSSVLLVMLYALAGHTRAWSSHLAVELAAAAVWGLGTVAWMLGEGAAATIAWMAFLVGTIAGERRELTQLVRLPRAARVLFLVLALVGGAAALLAVAAAAGLQLVARDTSSGLWWAACAALALWLLRWDIAPRQRQRPGWIGHTGWCLTLGYLWLLVAALLGAWGLWQPGGAATMAPHAVLLGFVFAMVFGHAPIMLPALTRLRPVYTPWARVPLWLLAASLVLRALALQAGNGTMLAVAGAGHALAIVAFAATMAGAVWRGVSRGRG